MDTVLALIPIIPAMIEAGKSVWIELVKPILIGKGYKWTNEQEQEMLELERKKDINAIIEKLERLNKELNQIIVTQTQTGDNSPQVGINEGQMITNYNFNTPEKKEEVKKN